PSSRPAASHGSRAWRRSPSSVGCAGRRCRASSRDWRRTSLHHAVARRPACCGCRIPATARRTRRAPTGPGAPRRPTAGCGWAASAATGRPAGRPAGATAASVAGTGTGTCAPAATGAPGRRDQVAHSWRSKIPAPPGVMMPRRGSGGLPRHHRQREPGDAAQALALIVDPDLPDMGAGTDVDWPGGAGDLPLADRADMVGVDFEADADLVGPDAEIACGAAEGFGKQDGSAAVQQAVRLPGPAFDGHRRLQPVVAGGSEDDAQGLYCGVTGQLVELL